MKANHSLEDFVINLELFAEGDNPPVDDPPADDPINDPPADGDNDNDPPADDDEEFDEILYNKETVKIPKSQRQTYLQKGMNYDKVHGRAQTLETTLQRAAKAQGFDSVESYLAAVEEAEKEQEQKRYQENPLEAVKNTVQRELTSHYEQQNRVQEQKKALKDKPFFSELESDIDAMVSESAARGQRVDVETVYLYLRGQKLEELLDKKQKDTEKRTVANIHDRLKRGGVVNNDASGGDDVDISTIDVGMASAFGSDPKQIAKYVKQQSKRS